MTESIYITCIKCNSHIAYEDASFCSNCGTSLENFCTNDECELNQEDTLDTIATNDRYCYCCGAKSLYLSLGLLEPYEA